MTEIRAFITDSDLLSADSEQILGTISIRYERRYLESKTERQKSGALAAALLLKSFAGIGREYGMECNEHGKPYVPGKPHFSLSHSDELTVLAVSETMPVGIDIEQIGRVTPRVIRKVSSIDMSSVSELDLAREWTRVEAALKLKGTGFYADPLKLDKETLFFTSCVHDGRYITCAAETEHVLKAGLVRFEVKGNNITYTIESIQKG